MLFLKFFLFATFMAGTSYCMSIECYVLRETECQDNEMSKEIPKDVEDLRNFCTNIIPLAHCTLRILEKCAKNESLPYDTEDGVEEFRKSMEFIESSCDEDSRVFKGIADNMPCVGSTLDTMDDICTWNGINGTAREKVFNIVDEDSYKHCAMDAWVFHCLTAKFDVECGSEAKYAVSEILDNTDYIWPKCRNVKNELYYFQDAFEKEFREGKQGQAVVPGIMKAISEESN